MISRTTLAGVLYAASKDHPSRTAVVFPDRRCDYSALWDRVQGWARRFLGLGVQPGEHIGLIMINSLDMVEVLFGIAAAGAVAVPINPRYRASELEHVIENSDVSTIVVCDRVGDDLDLVARLSEALPEMGSSPDPWALTLAAAPRLRRVVLLGENPPAGCLAVADVEVLAERVDAKHVYRRCEQTSIREIALMIYTSGTTAAPKAAMISHEALVRVGTELGVDRYALTEDDRLWDPLPLFHMAGLLPLISAMVAGAAFLSMPRVDAAPGLAMIRDESATIGFIAFAPLALSMIDLPGYDPSDLSSLRIIHTNGSPDLLRRIQIAVPGALQVNPYGCTEAGGLVSTSEVTDSPEQRARYSGRPYAGIRVRIVDPFNEPVPTGASGEIVVKGYSLFSGYYRNPEATAAAFDDEGWFHTGDLGDLDADGRIRYIARIKDMLKVGGENVAAVEIESLLCRHDAVASAAVVGMPDPRLDEVPVAFVQLAPDASVTSGELIAFCAAEIASFKVPRQIHFVTSWPMSSTKVQKFRLRQSLQAGAVQDW